MKKLTITTFVLLFVATVAIGQTTTYYPQNRVYYHRNPFERTFTKIQKSPVFGTDSTSLKNYLADKLKNQTSQTEGQVKIGLLIDSTGKPICEWIENHSNFNMEKDKLNLIIDEMPKWDAGILANRKVDCAMTLVLTFNQQAFFVQSRYRTRGE